MKHAALLLLAASPASAGVFEALLASGADVFHATPVVLRAPAPQRVGPMLQPSPRVLPFSPMAGRVRATARVDLAAQLDRQRALLARQLGAAPWNIGVAADAGLRTYYLTFFPVGRPEAVALAALGDLNRLRGEGVNARVDHATVYNVKVAINIFSPTRGSTLQLRPAAGTRGPGHDVKTGALLDAVKARATVFTAGGKEFWLLYGTDVAAGGSGFADTRSFLIIHENGLSSRAWPLAETALRPDVATTVDLGGTRVVFTRSSSGELVIGDPAR